MLQGRRFFVLQGRPIPVLAFISLLPPVLQGGRLPSPSRRLHVTVLQGRRCLSS